MQRISKKVKKIKLIYDVPWFLDEAKLELIYLTWCTLDTTVADFVIDL